MTSKLIDTLCVLVVWLAFWFVPDLDVKAGCKNV